MSKPWVLSKAVEFARIVKAFEDSGENRLGPSYRAIAGFAHEHCNLIGNALAKYEREKEKPQVQCPVTGQLDWFIIGDFNAMQKGVISHSIIALYNATFQKPLLQGLLVLERYPEDAECETEWMARLHESQESYDLGEDPVLTISGRREEVW